MVVTASSSLVVHRRFAIEWQRAVRERDLKVAPDDRTKLARPMQWMLDDLLPLLQEYHDRPIMDLGPLIRQLVMEKDFADGCGDRVIDDEYVAQLDLRVDLIITVLERVRLRCIEDHEWSDAPVAPQMFG